MKKVVIMIFVVTFVASVHGQQKPTKTKFYNFDEILIQGEHKKPKVLYLDTRKKVKFDKILRMKKSMLPNLLGTRKEPALR